MQPAPGWLRSDREAERSRRLLAGAFAVSILLHGLAALVLGRPPESPAAPPPPLVARLVPQPAPAPAVADKPAPAPPPVIKNTLDPPKAEVLEDPIKPQPRRRITERPEPQPPVPPPSAAKSAPQPELPAAAAPAPPPLAAREETPRRPLDLSVPAEPRDRRAERLSQQELTETLTRLSETMLYPSEALRRGLEGEVVIVVELGEGGRILEATIASGSGHAVLDEAAVRAVRKLGSLGPSTAHRTILLPVRFRIL